MEIYSAAERTILMLLYASGGKVPGKLWFQKEMFELSKAFKDVAEELDFDAYSYGPFSEALDEYRDMLENSGFIEDLTLTEKGKEISARFWETASIDEKNLIKNVVNFFERLDSDEILLYIYVTSPQMAERSEVKERIFRRRFNITARMLREGKISIGLASKLAGLPLSEMLRRVTKLGIKPFDAQQDLEGEN